VSDVQLLLRLCFLNRGGSDKQEWDEEMGRGMGTLSPLIWLGVPDTQDTWGLQQEMRDLGGGWGDATGEPRRTEVTDAGEPTRLSKEVGEG
jgi:hypothetical protein